MGAGLSKEISAVPVFPRKTLCRLVFGFIFLFLVYYAYSNTLVHQLRSPVLIFPYVDVTYWIFHLLKIPEFITGNNTVSWCFDISLFTFCILSFLFPARRLFVTLFFILYFIYFIIFNTYGNHHTHSKIGILLMPLPFMFPANRKFDYLWEAMRYFALFVYANAFLWKICRQVFFDSDHGLLIIQKNYAGYLYNHPGTTVALFYTWFLQHPLLIQWLFNIGIVLEGLFIAGFFTKRFDKFLFIISIILPFGFFIFANAFFFELTILSFTFMSFGKLAGSKLVYV